MAFQYERGLHWGEEGVGKDLAYPGKKATKMVKGGRGRNEAGIVAVREGQYSLRAFGWEAELGSVAVS